MSRTPAREALIDLGFTALEADVYIHLLGESPVTGYRVARGIGKPAANTYKAIESLARRGAVLVEEGESRLCRPVPPQELLDALERRFRATRETAGRELEKLGPADVDDGVYQLGTEDQILERCRKMIGRADDVLILDVFPDALEHLRPDIEAARDRGVTVGMKIYAANSIRGVDKALDPYGDAVLQAIPGSWIVCLVGGREVLVASLCGDGATPIQAIWTASPFLTSVLHGGLYAEIALAVLQRSIDERLGHKTLRRKYRELHGRLSPRSELYADLLERLRRASS